MIRQYLFKSLFIPFAFVATTAAGQINMNDSLELSTVIHQVLETYPTVQLAAEAIHAADLKIDLAKSSFSPNAQFTGSFAHIGPVPSLTLPEVGSFSLAPENNFNAVVSVNQTITDFGKTRKSIELEEQGKHLSKLSLEQVKQKLSLLVIGCYYNMLYFQEAVHIKEDQLNTLELHLRTVEKKTETGSATQYEILSTKVRISTIESQKTDVLTALNYQNTILNTLLGESVSTTHRVKKRLSSDFLSFSDDSLIRVAMRNRTELKIAEKKLTIAQVSRSLIKKHENPVLSAFANGGWKNGYIPQLDKPKANYALGLSLLIPIYDAKRTDLNTKLAGSSILSNNFELDLIKRNITSEVIENINSLKASVSKLNLFNMQLSQARKALDLAELKFKAGTLTNLDLLDAENSVAESNLLFLKSSIDKEMVGFRLKSALGLQLY